MNPSLKMIGLTAFFLMGLLTIQIQSGYSAFPLVQECACGNSAWRAVIPRGEKVTSALQRAYPDGTFTIKVQSRTLTVRFK